MRVKPAAIGALTLAVLFTLSFVTPASAQQGSRVERRLALNPGGRFVLSTELGGVTVIGDSSGGAVVTVTSTREDLNDKLDFQFEERGGEVSVTALRKARVSRLWNSDWFRGGIRFEVHVPRRTAIDIHTSGGGIDVSALTGETRVETSGGGLQLSDIDGSVHADTSGGGIHLRSITGAIMAKTSGGGIDIRDARDRVDAHTSGGSVSVAFAAGNNRGGELSSSGGGVSAEVDPGVALSIDASSSGGGVSSDLGMTVRGTIGRGALRGDINGGGALLRLHSSGGGVRIRAAGRTSASR